MSTHLDPELEGLRTGCVNYIELCGVSIREPIALLVTYFLRLLSPSSSPSPLIPYAFPALHKPPILHSRHFFTVALNSI